MHGHQFDVISHSNPELIEVYCFRYYLSRDLMPQLLLQATKRAAHFTAEGTSHGSSFRSEKTSEDKTGS
jgi:hypothetical protein